MHLPSRHIPHSSTGISTRVTNPPKAGEGKTYVSSISHLKYCLLKSGEPYILIAQ